MQETVSGFAESDKPSEDAPRSPFAGCLIVIVIGVVIAILVTATAYSLKKQTDVYKTFTDTEAKPAPVADLTGKEAELNSLINRLRHFDHEMANDRAATIELSANEVNFAVAHFDILKDFRGQLHIDEISSDELKGTLHYPLRSTSELPSVVRSTLNIEERDNNLNGTFLAKPLLTDGKIILNLETITPSKGEVPAEVYAQMKRVLVTGNLEQAVKDDPKNPPELLLKARKLTSLGIQNDKLVLKYSPDEKPPSIKEESDALASKAKQLAALGAVILILTMILLFIVLARRQKAKRASAGE